MTSLEELEARVAALEAELGPIRQDAAAARVLAGGADRDVAAFAGRLEQEMRSGFSTLAVGQAEILALLNRLADPRDDAPG